MGYPRKALIALGTVAALLVPGMARVAARQQHPKSLRLVHVVRPGETLWQIARQLDPGSDILVAVDRLERENHLSGGGVHPGQPLFLPAG